MHDEYAEELQLFLGDARVALVHEWIAARAGSEKVFEELAKLLPQADLYALSHEPGVGLDVGDRPIHTTWLDRHPALRARRDLTLPLMPIAWRQFTHEYDVVISSSHAFSRCFPAARSAQHLSYVHTPARYLWTPELDGRRPPRWARPMAAWLRRTDLRISRNVTSFAANSGEVRQRVRTFYGRDARVIAPPVDVDRFDLPPTGTEPRRGLLCFGRWIEYKRFDLAIEAAHLAGESLTVAGTGPEEHRLRDLAQRLGSDVTFVVRPSDGDVVRLMQTHRALLFPGREDFGIIPVEAAAAGLPTIALASGGARDTVCHEVSGLLVEEQSAQDFQRAIMRSREIRFDPVRVRSVALAFGVDRFRKEVVEWITTSVHR